MLIAPGTLHPVVGFAALLAIAIGAGASGALNMWWDADIDARMARTRLRAVPSGLIAPREALGFGLTLVVPLGADAGRGRQSARGGAARLHDLLLRRHLHDVAEAADAAEHRDRRRRGRVAADRRLRRGERQRDAATASGCSRIIFIWTPPHFWALALVKARDYERVGVPMMPNAKGADRTRLEILVYSLLLAPLGSSRGSPGLAARSTASRRCVLGGRFLSARVRGSISCATASRPTSAPMALFGYLDPLSVRAVRVARRRARLRPVRAVGAVNVRVATSPAGGPLTPAQLRNRRLTQHRDRAGRRRFSRCCSTPSPS